MSAQQIPAEFKWLFWVGPIWVLTVFTFQALRRKRLGIPILMPSTPAASERQTWISVGANPLLHAKNCAWVRLTETAGTVGLHFPFNLGIPGFLIEAFGLEADMPLESIIRLEEKQSVLLGSGLTIHYRAVGASLSVTLWTSRRDTLARKLTEMARKRGAAA